MTIKINRSMWAFIIMALGGLAVIAGAYFQYRNRLDDQKSALAKEQTRQKESEQRATEAEAILTKATDIISSQKDVIDQAQKIVELQNKLAEKNDEIIKLQNKALAQTTGGDSYPFIKHAIWVNEKMISFELENTFDYPIYDLELLYTDPIKKVHVRKNMGTISPKTFKILYECSMPPNTTREIHTFTMTCRTGQYEQVFNVTKDESSIFIVHGHIQKITDGVSKIIKTY